MLSYAPRYTSGNVRGINPFHHQAFDLDFGHDGTC
jgi:hypothetical protein